MVDVLEVREFLEGMAAGLAAKKITEEEVERIRTATAATKKRLNPETLRRLLRKTRFSISLSLIAAATKR